MICQLILPVVGVKKIVVLAQEWACWLSTVLALSLPLVSAFVQPSFQKVFEAPGGLHIERHDLQDWDILKKWPCGWTHHLVLASGTLKFF
jgi:hypothetical protein